MSTKFTLTKCIEGYMLSLYARRLSERTIESYETILRRFSEFLGKSITMADITPDHVRGFLASIKASNKTLLNYYITLSALWTWGTAEEIVPKNIIRGIEAPKPEKREIQPFSEDQVKDMLASLAKSKTYTRPGKALSDHSLRTSERNRAMLLLMVDTGLRASELCGLRIQDVDQKQSRIFVMGKGSKERSLPFSARTGQAIWKYLASVPDRRPDQPVFLTVYGHDFDRKQLRKLIVSIGSRAGVPNAHPHRFRHTFAIQYLRNGGDPYTLQRMLGHSTMEMVRTYLQIAQVDLDAAHRRASPVDGWRL
jgi:site-specific recombinase XerD